ncbi:MAG: Conserved TM helix repeat-containing protein [Candidatus Nomurabacteria bacterium GW2011_GWE1_32_28]|uniref:Conserved TM helix repeat-containing protein n=1 Tax=Candidatus Nomurabacteria bacterium GW2011_GWF1_31_48 TaxID=1618767 RepID=A0A0G0ATS8_9BACT|nr:MAG: Conserved TM helix repeat-containing protein [Candidatus Nomurabacteria bacterium GW2011_GWF2_30_133]KKP28470.1 MAG: Conserved TM helix repeat-containing protein [Candidatus Nomurabacteria bacterium GW2011_GWE2_31_40]KKP30050.1 MAG: Conserved TM helix repeat-containing protein [Candidatus Nomurabacteria bacterium GW2011_GWF1_31_48]KKP34569.1 MAG: Conserved TM helix repeat-containing protein [Candidatus Nomurabacteria bacterium GW2011_GWE1_32_28]
MTWGDVFNVSLQSLWWAFIQFAPRLILAIILFVVGWVLGSLVAKAFEQVFGTLKIDNIFKSIGVDDFFRKAGMNLNSGHFVGEVMKWFIIIIFLLPSLNLIGLDSIAYFLKDDVLGFLPKVIIAAFVLIIATILAEFLSKTAYASARAMNLKSAHMLSSLVKYTVWAFAFIIALGQLGVAEGYMNTLFAGIVGMLALGGALAFGLGAKDAAGRLISKLGEEMSHKE